MRQVVDDVDRALVSAVVGVAHQLGMRTVAEQVDRPGLVTHLRARRRLPGRVEFMQVPAQPVEDPGAFGNEVLAVADQ